MLNVTFFFLAVMSLSLPTDSLIYKQSVALRIIAIITSQTPLVT